MTSTLTLQMHLGGRWRDAATVAMDPERPWVQLTHDVDHVFAADDAVASLPESYRSISLRHPFDVMPRSHEHWPALLEDLAPGGAARRWWVEREGLGRMSPDAQFGWLLEHATIAPVGHLRVKDSVERIPGAASAERFPVEAVLERDYAFLEHATQQGASVGGATGAGGDAPKMLLRVTDAGDVWIDSLQNDDLPDAHVLVKFPRRSLAPRDGGALRETQRDRIILESEHVYYLALDALGIDTVDVAGLQLRRNGDGQPSLWMPRFDVPTVDTGERWGLESLYSLCDRPAGSVADHQDFLDVLHRVIVEGEFVGGKRASQSASPAGTALALEYIRRDLLDVVFGNADNHGRNKAVLKTPEGVVLAPVFDFAPMAMDPGGITRSTRWTRSGERAAGLDWREICRAQSHIADVDRLWEALREFALRLVDLDARLEGLGLPRETLEFPGIGLARTNETLRAWDLVP